MPVQFPPQDRRADLVFEGYQALGAGIGSGVRSLGEALEKRRDESKRLNAAGKAAKAFLKATGEDPMETEAMSFRDAIGKMTGRQTAQDYKRGVADTARFLASAAREQEELSNAERYPDYAGRLVDAAEPSISQKQDFYEGVGAGGTEMPTEAMRPTARALTARDFLEASRGSGYRMGTPDVRLLEATEQGAGVQPPVTSELPGGQIGYGFPGTKVRGVYPDMNKALQTEEITLPSGEVVTVMRMPGARTGQALRERGEITPESKLQALTAMHNSLIARRKYAEAAKVQKRMEALMGGEAGEESSEAPGATELPRTKEGRIDAGKLKVGSRYNSVQGVVEWDGQRFVKE